MHHTGNIPKEAVIKKIEQQTADTWTFTLELKDSEHKKSYSFKPGQFNMVTIPAIGESAISISSDPASSGMLEHTVRKVGSVTGVLFGLKDGDVLGIRGPYGTSWPVEEAKGRDVVIITGGIGLAPLRPVICHILNNRKDYGKVDIVYGARTCKDMLYTKEFTSWQDKKNDINLVLTVDKVEDGDKWDKNVGVVTTCFDKANLDPKNTVVMTCGPEIMMKFVVKCLKEKGFSDEQIYVSLERRMQCGVGRCGHCQIGKYFVCKDGAVFRYDQVKGLPDLGI
ncbi:MAG: FAD/NAD(P)-binding protein [Armatimonadota bacterium]